MCELMFFRDKEGCHFTLLTNVTDYIVTFFL